MSGITFNLHLKILRSSNIPAASHTSWPKKIVKFNILSQFLSFIMQKTVRHILISKKYLVCLGKDEKRSIMIKVIGFVTFLTKVRD